MRQIEMELEIAEREHSGVGQEEQSVLDRWTSLMTGDVEE